MKTHKSAAVLTVFDAPKFTKKGRKNVAAWLRRQAAFIESHNAELSKRFRARYLYA